MLTATGRRAVTDGIGLEALGVEIAKNGDVAVGPDLMTGAAGVYAAGDLIGAPQLASTGIAQAAANPHPHPHLTLTLALTLIRGP